MWKTLDSISINAKTKTNNAPERAKPVSAGVECAATRWDRDWKRTRVLRETQKSHVLMEHSVGVNYAFLFNWREVVTRVRVPLYVFVRSNCVKASGFLSQLK